MTIQDPATHARARQHAAYRYEAARRNLTSKLRSRANTDTRVAIRRQDLIPQRERALDRASHMLVPLSRFIKREIRQWSHHGFVEEHLIDTDDVLMTAIIEAGEQLTAQPGSNGIYPWLRRITQQKIREEVAAESERAELVRSLDAPVRIAGVDWPDRAVALREVLADPGAVLPETIIEQKETWEVLDHALNQLPERWREIFLLRTVDAWDDDEIAAVEGMDVSDVELINVAARAFLRERLLETELAVTE
jgi:RNA polymerase sigma factor (sigma-70 family)